MPLFLLLLLVPPAAAATVTVDGGRWSALQDADPPRPEPRRAHAAERDVALEVVGDRVLIRATWRIDPGEAVWFAEPVIGCEELWVAFDHRGLEQGAGACSAPRDLHSAA